MRSYTFNLPPNPVDAHKLLNGAVYQRVNAESIAGNKMCIRICEQSKSRDQEEKYHAMIGEIAAQHEVGGRLLDAESMKRLLVDQFKAETLKDPDLAPYWQEFGDVAMVPSLDGQRVVVLGIQTRKFKRKLASAFVEWLNAFAIETGVRFKARVNPDTGEILQ